MFFLSIVNEETSRHQGLTLTSLMVAVALSGVLAVAGVRLVVNQMTAFRVMELKDKGDSIFEFYSNLLHDDKVWLCTLYDGAPSTASPNRNMRNCVLGRGACTSGTLRLVGQNCRLQFTAQGARDFTAGNFTVGTVFIPAGGRILKDSVTQPASDGWWNVAVTWEHKTNREVDLILTQTFNEARWQTDTVEKRHLPELDYPRRARVRRSANYVSTSSDQTKAVTKIALHTASRTVGRHTDPLVDTTTSGLGNCHQQTPFGQVVMSVGTSNACSGARVAVTTPIDCGASYSVIDRIGIGSGMTAANNVKCALDGAGKLVQYSVCGGSSHQDSCSVAGKTFYSPSPFNRWERDSNGNWQWIPSRERVAQAGVARITYWGGLDCVGLPSWPAPTQGPAGPKGVPGGGPQGPPGPAYYETCR